MDTIAAIHTRRSIRSYEPRAVPREVIESIILDAVQAPTTPVSEPWVFYVIEGAERIAAYGERAKQYAREHRPSTAGYGWVDQPEFLVFFNAPAVVIICAPEANAQSIQDCNRAGQNLMLSAHARGLGTCWVGAPMLWIKSAAAKAELRVADGLTPFAVFTLGYAATVPPSRSRERPMIVWS